MTISIARLAKTPIDATEEVVYQVPTGGAASASQLIFCNTSASTVTINTNDKFLSLERMLQSVATSPVHQFYILLS
jgi:hypothetical protein